MQHTVQEERIQAILNGRRAEGTCTPSASVQPLVAGDSEMLVHVPPPPQIRTSHAQSDYTPQVSPYPISSTPSHTRISDQQQASPLQPSRTPVYTHETNQQKTVPAHTINTTPVNSKQQLHTMSHYSGNSTPQPSHENQQLRTPLQTNNVQMRPSHMSMLDDSDTDDLIELSPLCRPEATNRSSEWESFASHFTSEFEWLKAEVEMLRNEVQQLKKANKGSKVHVTLCSFMFHYCQ